MSVATLPSPQLLTPITPLFPTGPAMANPSPYTTKPKPKPARLTHPALFTGLATPPYSPLSPTSAAAAAAASPSTPVSATATAAASAATAVVTHPPVPGYAALRAGHIHAVQYVIAKLRWEQKNNLYLPGQDAQWNHDRVILELEAELAGAKAAAERFDRFPNVHAPVAETEPKPHGPRTEEADREHTKVEKEKERALNDKLEAAFPFLKQMFVGPMTKQQYRNDKLLRERVQVNNFEDLSILLPTVNMKFLMDGQGKKKVFDRKAYEAARQEKEKAKVAAELKADKDVNNAVAIAAAAAGNAGAGKRIGPLTKDEYLSTLPQYGPMTEAESKLPKQREQRHDILEWFRRPWGKFDEEAAGLMEQLAELAKKRTDEVKKAKEELSKEAKAKVEKETEAEEKKEERQEKKEDKEEEKKEQEKAENAEEAKE